MNYNNGINIASASFHVLKDATTSQAVTAATNVNIELYQLKIELLKIEL